MKERPVLFNGPMVRAILDGRKTQTRRVVKPQPTNGWSFETANGDAMRLGTITSPHPKKGRFGIFIRREIHPGSGKFEHDIIPCPYGQPGDRLWVRETWSVNFYGGHSGDGEVYQHFGIEYSAGGAAMDIELGHYDETLTRLFDTQRGDWRPSIFMPRWASRILLEIIDVRVERLREISEADAVAEGVEDSPFWEEAERLEPATGSPTERYAFRALWESINGAGSWEANPWVWVVEFERIDAEAKAA